MFDFASSPDLQPLHFLLARRHLARTRAGGKPRDEFVELSDLLFALRVLRFDARADLRLRQHHVVIAAGISDDRLVIDIGDMGADAVQEMAIVRDHDQRSLVAQHEILQPVDGFEIEMVRGLVEQQRVGAAEKRLGEQHAHLLAALQLAHFPVVQGFGNIQAVEQDRRIALGRVAVVFGDNSFEFAEPHAVLIGHVGFRVELVAFRERLPERAIAHDDRIDHAEGIERELVLAQNADALRANHVALLGFQFSGQDLHEGGLAAAVRPRQAIAPGGQEDG